MYPYGTSIFVLICTALWLYLYFFLPETKGRSVEDITAEFRTRTQGETTCNCFTSNTDADNDER